MTNTMLTQSRLHAGTWDVVLHADGPDTPDLTATHAGTKLPGLTCVPGDQPHSWRISLPIPAHVLTDGLQTIILSAADGTQVGSLAIMAGDVLADDLRAEISLLRSELDLLKSAVRRLHVENQSQMRQP